MFAFTIPFAWMLLSVIFGDFSFSELPRPEHTEPMRENGFPFFELTSTLYSISHSAIVFMFVFGLTFFIFRRPILELGGWFIHVLIDIPTHTYQFYPTPFLWPVSEWKFDGFSWGTPWFMVLNYSAIVLVYWLLKNRRKSAPVNP